MKTKLHMFVTESNRIEGILRPPTQQELDAHMKFLKLGKVGRDNPSCP